MFFSVSFFLPCTPSQTKYNIRVGTVNRLYRIYTPDQQTKLV
ncbi:hypothetical protein DSUL_50368 [Desulfovibrionales bacterium]